MKQIPKQITQKLYITLHVETQTVTVSTWKLTLPQFLPLHITEVTIDLPSDEGVIAREAAASLDTMKKELYAKFEEALQRLESAQAKFLALEN